MTQIIQGDCLTVLKTLPTVSVHCCVTSPPYWGLRDYGCEGQLGLEKTPEEYVAKLVEVFGEVRRVLRDDGTVWLNLGDSYCANRGNTIDKPGFDNKAAQGHAGLAIRPHKIGGNGIKEKDLVGIPWMVAFALRADGWYLRSDIIWAKPNPMPESVADRPTKSHEYLFLLTKSAKYYYDAEAIKEKQTESTIKRAAYGWNGRTDDNSNGSRTGSTFKRMAETGEPIGTIPADGKRNKRSVWTVATVGNGCGEHFAVFPPKLITPCILAGCPVGGTVLDPFGGSGTVGEVSENHGRNSILIELKPEYCEMAKQRTAQQGLFARSA